MLRRLSKPPFHSDRLNRLGSLFLTLPSRALTGQHVICSLAGSRSKLPRINPAAAEDLGCHALDALTLAAGDRREDHRSEEPRSYLRRQAEHDRGDHQRGAAEMEECRTQYHHVRSVAGSDKGFVDAADRRAAGRGVRLRSGSTAASSGSRGGCSSGFCRSGPPPSAALKPTTSSGPGSKASPNGSCDGASLPKPKMSRPAGGTCARPQVGDRVARRGSVSNRPFAVIRTGFLPSGFAKNSASLTAARPARDRLNA